jgi:predicted ferric reductase
MMLALSQLADTASQVALSRVANSWPWYVIRASGFVSAGLLLLLMLSGIGQVTGLTYKIWEPVKAWAIHKAMGIALCVSIAIHILTLLIDKYVSFSIPQIVVPFLSHYTNGAKLLGLSLSWIAVASGILAMYGVAMIVASSLGWIDTHKKTWRWLHYASYAVVLLVFVHGLGVGTDLAHGAWRVLWMIVGAILVVGIISRLRRVGTLNK